MKKGLKAKLLAIVFFMITTGCSTKQKSEFDNQFTNIGGKSSMKVNFDQTLDENAEYSEVVDFLMAYKEAVLNSYSYILENKCEDCDVGVDIIYVESPTRNPNLEYDVAINFDYYETGTTALDGLVEYERIYEIDNLKELRIDYKNKSYNSQVTTYHAEPGTARVRRYWSSYYSNPYQEYLYHIWDTLPEIETLEYFSDNEKNNHQLDSYSIKKIDEQNIEISINIKGADYMISSFNYDKWEKNITYKINTETLEMEKTSGNYTAYIHNVGDYLGIKLPNDLDSYPKQSDNN